MKSKLQHINVAVLFVSNLERSKSFYRDKLHLPLKFEDQSSAAFDLDPVMLMVLDITGARDLLSDDVVPPPQPAGATSQLVAFVEDVDEAYAELVAEGVEFLRKPVSREWGMRTAHFKDPDGHIWELAQPVAQEQASPE